MEKISKNIEGCIISILNIINGTFWTSVGILWFVLLIIIITYFSSLIIKILINMF